MRQQILDEFRNHEEASAKALELLGVELNESDSAFVQAELERREQFLVALLQKEQRYY